MENPPGTYSHPHPNAGKEDTLGDLTPDGNQSVIVDEHGHAYEHRWPAYRNARVFVSSLLDRIPHGERLMLLLTLIIAFSAVSQTVVSCNNNASTAKQVDRLIDAANRIDDAANSFSRSAAHINDGVTDAVAQLQTQADKMDKARDSSERQSRRALQATIDDFHLDQRAWVGVTEAILIPVPPRFGSELIVVVSVRNTGKTPAKNTVLQANKQVRASESVLDFSYKGVPGNYVGLIAPGATVDVRFPVAVDPETGVSLGLRKDDLDAINSGKDILFVHGHITFDDSFKRHHFLDYCFRLNPKSGYTFSSCTVHNGDDN